MMIFYVVSEPCAKNICHILTEEVIPLKGRIKWHQSVPQFWTLLGRSRKLIQLLTGNCDSNNSAYDFDSGFQYFGLLSGVAA